MGLGYESILGPGGAGVVATADAAAVASSASLLDASPAPQIVIPANSLFVGAKLRVVAIGKFSNTATPTLLSGLYWGGVAGTKLASTGAITTVTAAANWPYQLEAEIVCRAIGTSGSLLTWGRVRMPASLTQFQAEYPIDSAAIAAVTVDTTAAKALTLGVQWGTSSPSNTFTCNEFVIEAQNF